MSSYQPKLCKPSLAARVPQTAMSHSQAMTASNYQCGPLQDVRCLVCGMHNSKPTEDMIQAMGGKIHVIQRTSQRMPDVIVCDSASARRLQVRLSFA